MRISFWLLGDLHIPVRYSPGMSSHAVPPRGRAAAAAPATASGVSTP